MDTLSRNSNMGRNTILCLLMATLDLVVVRFSGSILMYGDILPDSLFLWFMNPPFWPYIYFEHSNRFSPLFKINIKWFFLKCIIFAIASSKIKKKILRIAIVLLLFWYLWEIVDLSLLIFATGRHLCVGKTILRIVKL